MSFAIRNYCCVNASNPACCSTSGALEETLDVTSEGNRVRPFKNDRAPSRPVNNGGANASISTHSDVWNERDENLLLILLQARLTEITLRKRKGANNIGIPRKTKGSWSDSLIIWRPNASLADAHLDVSGPRILDLDAASHRASSTGRILVRQSQGMDKQMLTIHL